MPTIMFMIFARIRILFTNRLRSINGAIAFLSTIIKNDREIIAAAPKPITMGTSSECAALIVCMNCNATRKEITVIYIVIAPRMSIVDLFLLILMLLLSYSVIVLLLSERSMSLLT